MRLEHWDPNSDGALTEEALRRKLEQLGYHVTRYVYPPGAYFPNHSHAMDKIDAVVSGHFEMTIEGQTCVLEAGGYLFVPRGAVHSAKVLGNTPVVSLDAVKPL